MIGYTPFDRDTQQQETEAIIAGAYRFEPGQSRRRSILCWALSRSTEEYWANVSDTARDFVSYCLTVDATQRPTAKQALEHKVRSLLSPSAPPARPSYAAVSLSGYLTSNPTSFLIPKVRLADRRTFSRRSRMHLTQERLVSCHLLWIFITAS